MGRFHLDGPVCQKETSTSMTQFSNVENPPKGHMRLKSQFHNTQFCQFPDHSFFKCQFKCRRCTAFQTRRLSARWGYKLRYRSFSQIGTRASVGQWKCWVPSVSRLRDAALDKRGFSIIQKNNMWTLSHKFLALRFMTVNWLRQKPDEIIHNSPVGFKNKLQLKLWCYTVYKLFLAVWTVLFSIAPRFSWSRKTLGVDLLLSFFSDLISCKFNVYNTGFVSGGGAQGRCVMSVQPTFSEGKKTLLQNSWKMFTKDKLIIWNITVLIRKLTTNGT